MIGRVRGATWGHVGVMIGRVRGATWGERPGWVRVTARGLGGGGRTLGLLQHVGAKADNGLEAVLGSVT
eukprot:5022933-Prymnesium_polylepis.1